MDQEEDYLDFKSLRAKFQDEEVLLKQLRTKPALLVKPKVLPPPHSPTNSLPSFSPTSHTPSNSHTLPQGARPSLLSSLQGKGGIAPRVVFEEKEKKVKGKDKSEGKVKLPGKKKAEADKEKADGKMNGGKDNVEDGMRSDLLYQKQKKKADPVIKNKNMSLLSPREYKGGSVELVDVSPPPIKATAKKKGFRGIGKQSGKKGKEEKGEFPPLSMLDIASPDMAGPEPLIALTTFRTPSPPANIPISTALIPPAPAAHIILLSPELLPSTLITAPAAETIAVVTPPKPIPMSPNPPIVEPIPETQTPVAPPTLEVETPAETIPVPTLPVLVHPSPTPSPVPAPPSPVPTPPVTPNPSAIPTPPPPTIATPRRPVIATPPPPADPTPSPPAPSPKPPAPELVPVPESVVVEVAIVVEASASPPPSHTPPPPAVDPPVTPERPVRVQERPLSALLALGRAEEMSPPKKRGSQKIFNALEKAKRKFASPVTIEDQPPLFHKSLSELPPIDYDDQARAGPPTPLKPALVNGVDVRQAFPVLEGRAGDVIPYLLVAPPLLLRRCLPEASTLRPLQEKPLHLPFMDLTAHAVEIPAPLEFSIANQALDVPDVGSEVLKLEAQEIQLADLLELERSEWGNREYGDNIPETVLLKQEILEEGEGLPEFEDHRVPEFGVELREIPESEPVVEIPLEVPVEFTVPASPSSQDPQPAAGAQAKDGTYEICDNANEDMPSAKQKVKGQPIKKKKEPKNPYAETPIERTPKTGWSFKKNTPETPDEKDLKKKEKQHLEKEKKERKNKEREKKEREKKEREKKEREKKEQKESEKKEQKEREKKENEMKKFKITGQEEAIYEATVTVASKGRQNSLAVKNRDIVSIIRTTNCPKGKWLARDRSNTYGYISVSKVELDIKEMLELGKKASHGISHKDINTLVEQGGEVASMSSRTYNHYPLQEDTGSFTDESEEWTCDDVEPLSSPIEGDPTESGHIRTMSMMGSREPSIHHQHTLSDTTIDGIDMQARHEALQKLATFFHKPVVEEPIRRPEEPEPEEEPISPVDIEEPGYLCKEEADLELPDMVILPPPDLYADDQ